MSKLRHWLYEHIDELTKVAVGVIIASVVLGIIALFLIFT